MAFTFRSYTTKTASSHVLTVTVDKPAGTAENDIIFAFFTVRSGGDVTGAPAGWTLQGSQPTGGDRYRVYSKIAGASEPATYDFSITANYLYRATLSSYYNFNLTDTIEAVSATEYYTNNTILRAASLNTTQNNSPLIFFGGCYTSGSARTITKPGNIGSDAWVQTYNNVGSWSQIICNIKLSTAGATGDMDASLDNALTSKAAIVIALNPLVVAPTVTTQAVSDITSTTAAGNGNVTSDGDTTITERGVCWSTSSGPTTASSKATSAGTTGAFTASITSLSAGVLYYVRAYAVNSVGTSYGSEVTFTTDNAPTVTTQNPSNIASTTVTGNGTVVSDNGDAITERGFCWALTANPTTSSSKVTASGTTGSFTASITGLTENTTYHVRAYAINAVGTSYGADIEFGTAGKPTVTTQAVSEIDLTQAVLNGTVVSDNQYTITERGFCYKTSTGPTTSDTKVIVSGTTGAYYGSATGLSNSTLYYVRAYAINSAGTSYGSEVTFTTLSASDKQLIKDIGATTGEQYSVSINVGGTTGTLTVKLGTTGYSQVINAGAGVTIATGEYAGLSGLILESSDGSDVTVDNVYWVKLLGGTEVIDWDLDQYTSYIPIDSSVKFKRVEDKELTRFDMYRYLDAEFKDLDGYVTLTITEEANDKSQNRNKTFVVGNETGVLSPFVKKRISMLSKNQALVIQFSNAKLSETFTICQYQLTGFKESRKLYKLSKIISI